jgi:hypothetical protein
MRGQAQKQCSLLRRMAAGRKRCCSSMVIIRRGVIAACHWTPVWLQKDSRRLSYLRRRGCHALLETKWRGVYFE